MAKPLGKNRKLYIQSGTPGTFSEIRGQRTLNRSRETNLIDTSDKSSGAYGSRAPGQIQLTIGVGGVVSTPDLNGLERLFGLVTSQQPEVYQIRDAPYTDSDVVFQGSMVATSGNDTADKDAACEWSVTLSAEDAPTVDLLG